MHGWRVVFIWRVPAATRHWGETPTTSWRKMSDEAHEQRSGRARTFSPHASACLFHLFCLLQPCLQTAELKACAYWWPLTHSGFEMKQFPSASLLPYPELLPVSGVFTSTQTFGPSLCWTNPRWTIAGLSLFIDKLLSCISQRQKGFCLVHSWPEHGGVGSSEIRLHVWECFYFASVWQETPRIGVRTGWSVDTNEPQRKSLRPWSETLLYEKMFGSVFLPNAACIWLLPVYTCMLVAGLVHVPNTSFPRGVPGPCHNRPASPHFLILVCLRSELVFWHCSDWAGVGPSGFCRVSTGTEK